MPLKPPAPVFEEADLLELQQAYNLACRELDIDPHPIDRSTNADTREALAKAIMDSAAMGLRDPRILRMRALQALRNQDSSTH